MIHGGENETSNSIDEDRIAQRHSLVQLVWYKVLEEDPDKQGSAPEGISKMCDISATGMGLHVMEPLPVGRFIFTEISTRSFTFSAVGKIVYSKAGEAGYYRVGVQFLVIPPNDRWYLDKFFNAHGKDRP